MENNIKLSNHFKVNYLTIILFLLFFIPLFFVLSNKVESNDDINAVSNSLPANNEEISKFLNTAINNPNCDSYLNLGFAYYRNKMYRECIIVTERALSFNPNSATAYNNIGSCYNELHQWDKAIDACTIAIQLDSTFTLAKNNRAWAISQKQAGAQ